MDELNENYKLLVSAIITLAIDDYKAALRAEIIGAEFRPPFDDKKIITSKSVERFFLSAWGQLLLNGLGQEAINLARKAVEAETETETPHRITIKNYGRTRNETE